MFSGVVAVFWVSKMLLSKKLDRVVTASILDVSSTGIQTGLKTVSESLYQTTQNISFFGGITMSVSVMPAWAKASLSTR